MLLCKELLIFCRDTLSLQPAKRYESNASEALGDTIMTEALAAWRPRALSVLRIITGLLIIQHGMGKIFHFPALPAYANVQPLSLFGAAGFLSLIHISEPTRR